MPANQLSHPADAIICTQPLGALYTPEATTFRVWAPTANRVRLNLYDAPVGGAARTMAMRKSRDGSWSTVLLGDWQGCYYTLSVAGRDARFNASRELIDPYARAVTGFNGRAIITHDETPVVDRPDFPRADAVIYEMHLRDFTIDPDSNVQRRGKYLGLTETGTHLTGRADITTGLDHLTELGVNVVQILPISEFHNDKVNDRYGWGYDAVHFQTPDGWFATERMDARRITEVKRMISALHARGIRVTLDVVFNHTYEAIHKHQVYSFEGLVPGYYYRLKPDGSYWNGSGTGNEFRTEAPMARRFILDSLKVWVNEYKVDGFRFDLLGLFDHETIRELVRELRAIDDKLLIYGEPWAGGTTPIEITHKGAQRGEGWSVFNDHFRDAVKGNVFDARAQGFVQSGANAAGVKRGLLGSIEDFAAAPLESINYVECHDNHTLWDRLLISTIDNAGVNDAARRAMDKLAAVLVFTAQGIPFIQAGQEFLRTKGGDHNSYDKPDSVNMLRWRMKAEHHDVYEYYRGLIALRRAHPLFRLERAEDVLRAVKFFDDHLGLTLPPGCIAMVIEDVTGRDGWKRAAVLCNANAKAVELEMLKGNWSIFGDARRVGTVALGEAQGPRVTVAARSALILGEARER